MRIGVDILGGDFAPQMTILGAIAAYKELPTEARMVLFGDEHQIKAMLEEHNIPIDAFDYVHTTEFIAMGEHPAKAFSQKPNSSITLGFKYLHEGKIDGFASAGNTGAMLVGASLTIKSIPGVIRPAIATFVPKIEGGWAIMLDVGLNPECKPDVLYQYGILGSYYSEFVLGISNPRVALLNIGSEKEKGNMLTKATHELMSGSKDFNFVGNVEGNDLFSDEKADVIVCDGFVGNVVLKEAEAFYTIIRKLKMRHEFFDQFNYENHGGTPILGVNSNVIIGHGVSNDKAIKKMILQTKEIIQGNLPERFRKVFK